ncbi:pyridoxal-dependent decarboxylase [Nostoc sp.]|uniref:pyridoxal-dependent decarboxylase n=1 Tax=Nostoc sp. TaxID=1180 RepID=UPI002FFB9CA6
MTGAVDDISKVVAILSELNISQFHIHVDGALGGMLIPYMEEATPLYFSRYPIGSIAVSGHKFIGSPVPCGVVLARKEKVQSFDIEYLGSTDTTITGSRNGLTPVILWDAIKQRKHLFKEEVLNCRRLAEYFWNKIAESRKFALINPFSTTVVFERPEKFIEKRWQLACYGKIAHIVVMQNHNQAILEQLLQELGV